MRHSLPSGARSPKGSRKGMPKSRYSARERRVNVRSRKRSNKVIPDIMKTSKGTDEIILGYLETLGSPRALTVWLLYRNGEHRELVGLSINPLQYDDADAFRIDYAATKFLSKCAGLKTGIDLKGVALDSAREAEQRCRDTNLRLRSFRNGSVRNPFDSKFFEAQMIISKILGGIPKRFHDVGWSHGRTSSAHGAQKTVVHKYHSRPDVTLSARKHCSDMLRESPLWGAALLNADGPCSVLPHVLNTVEGNHLITVPKNAKTDRTICYEPHMNIRLQLNVGSYIRARLKKFGINLDDQSINQRRAKLGSITSKLATIDLSMASDTVALELVWELLPFDWACLLDDLRSKYTIWPDGSTTRNEKFSSMGNGFTFELESLIFYALSSAVTEGVSVYGDDIIVPTDAYDEVVNLLNVCGFRTNDAKSFNKGWFRESCGEDVFRGLNCTPVYLRKLPKVRGDIAILHNNVRHWAAVNPHLKWAMLLRKWRCLNPLSNGPSGYGDGHYHVNFDEASPRRCPRGRDGWLFSSYSFVLSGYRRRKQDERVEEEVTGKFSQRFGWSALCAALGPKRTWNTYESLATSRQFSYKKTIGLANFSWPDVVWVS